ncbi:ABC transporter substrate-binding protein [Ensifer sp. LC54]|nr:ABC transporter substrate-binding protein [Ensifer sp. LC54]OCP18629.1 ABC transporter substrate-binding protein [Ensifer sp. LC384]
MEKIMRKLLSLTFGLSLLAGAASAEDISLRVAGNLLATGLIQQNKEKPFFENLAQTTGLPLAVDYKPMDVIGIKDSEGLRVLKSGLFDIVTLRIAQASRDEPFLLGADLVGVNANYETARKVVDAYREEFDKRLQHQFNGKLLAIWPFGPQVVFCNAEIRGLSDLQGKKVRVYDQSLAQFIEKIGGIPVTISFGETQQSLQRGVVDCAITGPSSANTAGWPEVATHFMPLGFQIALNAYAINLDSWNKFTPEQQAKLTEAFKALEDDIWGYSKELFEDASRCNVGREPCTTVKKFAMTEVPVTDEDLKTVQGAVQTVSFPAWSQVCEKSYPGCSELWKKLVGPTIGLQ